MKIEAKSVEDYLSKVPEERKGPMNALRDTINSNIPKGFEETMLYHMPAWVVPLSTYPAGYHTTPGEPLPFINIASQKNFVALYHMGVYADLDLLHWFQSEYPKHSATKLDMGKSCVRFKKPEAIPLELVGQLASKMTVERVIEIYEQNYKPKKKF